MGLLLQAKGHSSSNEAPNLYRLCIVFLTFSCIGYAMPFILCATICCCLPCIISVLGFREDLSQNRGATQDSINSLPTYKFKVKKIRAVVIRRIAQVQVKVALWSSERRRSVPIRGGCSSDVTILLAFVFDISGPSSDADVCCICLAKYVHNDELREMPCSHFFHKDCVDKWLKINATCPLCKAEVGETMLSSLTEATASLRNGTLL
ncbi:E3 ubiquitin-protein ligase [Sesamum angolense]|uniref:E3 ubiquitin-protein ligase n=1 Tax=Sesamum angolense TaxID=2727404 RepID=A0AAE1W8V4_9LAMI|nr:E3 ubiquitin-protein ligase [Sesamum angolense]